MFLSTNPCAVASSTPPLCRALKDQRRKGSQSKDRSDKRETGSGRPPGGCLRRNIAITGSGGRHKSRGTDFSGKAMFPWSLGTGVQLQSASRASRCRVAKSRASTVSSETHASAKTGPPALPRRAPSSVNGITIVIRNAHTVALKTDRRLQLRQSDRQRVCGCLRLPPGLSLVAREIPHILSARTVTF